MDYHELNLKEAKEFIYAGKSIFTVKNTKTGNRFTYKLIKATDTEKDMWWVRVLSGPDNTKHYMFLGTVFRSTTGFGKIYYHSKKSTVSPTAQSVRVWKYIMIHLNKKDLPPQIKFYHRNHCGRCGRTLTVPESIQSGFGPECIKKIKG